MPTVGQDGHSRTLESKSLANAFKSFKNDQSALIKIDDSTVMNDCGFQSRQKDLIFVQEPANILVNRVDTQSTDDSQDFGVPKHRRNQRFL